MMPADQGGAINREGAEMSVIDARYEYEVLAVTHEPCACGGFHIVTVKLAEGMQTAAFALGMIEQHGAHYDFGGDPLVSEGCVFCQNTVLAVKRWR